MKFSLNSVRNGLFKWQLVPIWVRRCLLCVKPVKYRVKIFRGVGKVWESENISSNDDVENYEIFVYVIFEKIICGIVPRKNTSLNFIRFFWENILCLNCQAHVAPFLTHQPTLRLSQTNVQKKIPKRKDKSFPLNSNAGGRSQRVQAVEKSILCETVLLNPMQIFRLYPQIYFYTFHKNLKFWKTIRGLEKSFCSQRPIFNFIHT